MSYVPTTWKAGDTVTSAKLNKIEQGLNTSANNIVIDSTTEDTAYLISQEAINSLDSAVQITESYDDIESYLSNGNIIIIKILAPNYNNTGTMVNWMPAVVTMDLSDPDATNPYYCYMLGFFTGTNMFSFYLGATSPTDPLYLIPAGNYDVSSLLYS